MKKIEVEILKDFSEAIPYDTRGIPLYIRTRRLSDYINMRSFPHWHDEIELMYIMEGKLNFNVNGRPILLNTHDCIIVNCRQMHHSSSYNLQDCVFFCIIFHPRLFTGIPSVYDRYVLPILSDPNFQYYHFDPKHPFHDTISQFIDDIQQYKQTGAWSYEMKVIGAMHLFWSDFIQQNKLAVVALSDTADLELKIQQDMLSFIHQNYMERITLDDIASAGNVCRSKCCAIFKQYVNTSPINFLNQYRLEVSCRLLKKEDLSITDIAVCCGFAHHSYYSQIFRKVYGCSPKEYREKI